MAGNSTASGEIRWTASTTVSRSTRGFPRAPRRIGAAVISSVIWCAVCRSTGATRRAASASTWWGCSPASGPPARRSWSRLAVKKGDTGISIGELLGSIITDPVFSLSIGALVADIVVSDLSAVLPTTQSLVGVSAVVLGLLYCQRGLGRREPWSRPPFRTSACVDGLLPPTAGPR